jgi:hypothetical protein
MNESMMGTGGRSYFVVQFKNAISMVIVTDDGRSFGAGSEETRGNVIDAIGKFNEQHGQ